MLEVRLLAQLPVGETKAKKQLSFQRLGGEVKGSLLSVEALSQAPIVYDERTQPIAVSALQLREQTEYTVEVRWEGEGSRPDLSCFPHLSPPVLRTEPLSSDRKQVLRARLQFRDYVGATWLHIWVGGIRVFGVALEVRSKKIDYIEDYVALLDALAGHSVGLLLRMGSPVHSHMSPDLGEASSSGLELFLLLRHLIRAPAFEEALQAVQESPTQALAYEWGWRPLHRVRATGPLAIRRAIQRSGPMRPVQIPGLPHTHLPAQMPQRTLTLAEDTPENRFVLTLLARLERLIQQLRHQLRGQPSSTQTELEQLLALVNQARRLVPFVSKLEPLAPGVVPRDGLSSRAGYRELLQMWDALDAGLQLVWEELSGVIAGPLRDLAQLYEYWCFFEISQVLQKLPGAHLLHAHFLQRTKSGWRIRLVRGTQPALVLKLRGATIRLFYQRRFGGGGEAYHSYSIALTPDFTLEIVRPDGQTVYLCLDAKYRPEGALEKMHAYRDALRGALGCYLLYPGEQAAPTLYHRHPRFPLPGVGAFPLRPSGEHDVWLLYFLQLAFEQIIPLER